MGVYEGEITGKGLKFCIVASRFNEFLTGRLIEGALDALKRHGTPEGNIDIVRVPGAFEIPLIAKRLAGKGKYNAIIALGTIIRGATPHFDYVAAEASKGIALASMETEVPIAFGIITSDTLEQAIERSGSKAGNKGWDAAMTAMEMANLLKKI